MAFADDIQSFMENRLKAFDPTIDLSPNSNAQQTIIAPLITKLGEDPFSVDISTFLRDRLIQEFPDLAADNAGLLEDLFTNPLQLILEPFKRQIQQSQLNMSVVNADLMGDDEADALGANFFEDRENGDFASGPVRVYFSAPTTTRITNDRQITSKSGLAFFPTDNTYITSQQMLFNREGDLYYVDITARAEQAGSDYNIDADQLISIDNVDGVVRITNKSPFSTGLPREDNSTYLNRIPQALTERSLVTKRGVDTRIPDTFGSGVRAVQVVGAGEDGMDRDILKGTGEGYLFLVASCTYYGSWVFIDTINYKDDGPNNDIVAQVGDTIRFILPLSTDPNRTVYTAVITQIVSTGLNTASEKYVLVLDRSLNTIAGITSPGSIAILKPGYITISGIPGGIAANVTVADDSVHLGGHSDVFIRPSADSTQVGVLPNITEGSPILAATDFVLTASSNEVTSSSGENYTQLGVKSGDIFVIESGASAGSYRILAIAPDDFNFQIDTVLSVSETDIRGRIVRTIAVDLVEPKNMKLPFTPGPVSDLQTTVGSTLFRLSTINVQSYGVVVGDTIRILDGLNAGDYVITGFDGTLGGQGPIVDRAASSTGSNQRYEIFTLSAGLSFPLVRIKSLELLDSTNQSTGITIPYGDAVDIRATCDIEGAGTKVRVLDKQIVAFPDASALWGSDGTLLPQSFASTTSGTSDARYSLGIDIADGRVRVAPSSGPPSIPINQTEVNMPPFLWNGRRDKLLAFTTREDPNFTVALPSGGQHRTSDIAEAKIGDSLVIIDGPNQGSYVIKDLRVMGLWSQSSVHGHQKIALVQLDRELPVDPLRTVLDFISQIGAVTPASATDLAAAITDSTIFFTSAFWLTSIVGNLTTTLTSLGFTITTDDVSAMLLDLCAYGYEIGPSAQGTFRLLFQEPVSAEFYFDQDPTSFQAINNSSLNYRITPGQDSAQILPQSNVATPATAWNRDMVLDQSDTTKAFLNSGSSFVQRGIQTGDTIEFHKAINDLPARQNMTSSWMFVTVSGQNLITAIFSGGTTSATPDNQLNIEAGQLFFIDSGPDTGAYNITEVVSTNFSADPPSVQFKIDKTLTHSTEVYPTILDRDFKSQVHAILETSGNTFPMALSGLTLQITYQATGVGPTNYTHVFGAGPFNAITDVVTDISGDATFTTNLEAVADGNELVIRTKLNNTPREQITVSNSSSSIGVLKYTALQTNGGYLGGVCVSGTKQIFGTGFSGFTAGQWISIYAANSSAILTAGDDSAYVGTYEIVSTGTQSGGPRNGYLYIELDRIANFPAEAEIRWLRHSAPSVTPTDTSNGGKTISTDYVRGRIYDSAVISATITIPWASVTNPILSTSPTQIQLSVSPVSGGVDYGHMDPYRIIRAGVIYVPSTQMAQNRVGALYYVDLPVIGVGTDSSLNIDTTVGLILTGQFNIKGYTLSVENELFAFSTQEQVSIIIPSSILPVGSTPSVDNEIKLIGQNIQVDYDDAPLVASIQQFFDSPLDRVLCANALVRHFLPSYVFLDVVYTGGDDETLVATDLISYINNIDPDLNQLSTDEITKIIHQHNVLKVKQPINLIVLTHGSDRKIRGTQSTDTIGGTDLPNFTGHYKQTYFIAGPDTSATNPRPSGEQVFIVRL